MKNDHGVVDNHAVYVILGVDAEGFKEVLGLYAYNVKKDLPFHKNGIMHLFEGSCRFHQKDQICDAA